MTEEEKKAKLAELRERMAEKKARKAEQDAQEHKANEIIRRKAAKVSTIVFFSPSKRTRCITVVSDAQDMGQIKEDLQLKQALRDAEQKKRGWSCSSLFFACFFLTV